MSQALHIFKKDVRHLRFEIAIAISVVAAFALIEARHVLWLVDPSYRRTAASTLAMFLLPLAWWTLIGRAIHDEALPGDRQFWITRPYSWSSLLGAKMLFVLAFINIPMLIADAVILRACGLPLAPAIPGLLWSQVLLTIVFLLPVFAISALTTGFVQLIAGILTPCVVALMFSIIRPGPGFIVGNFPGGIAGLRLGPTFGVFTAGYDWVQSYVLYFVIAVAGSAILLWQYRRRGTTVARCFAGATVILVVLPITLVPWTAAFRTQSWLTNKRVDLSAAHAEYDLDNVHLTRVFHMGDQMRVELPLQITGVPPVPGMPPDVSAQVEGFTVQFLAPDGSVRQIKQLPDYTYVEKGDRFTLRPYVDAAFFKQVKDQPLTIRGSVYLTVYGNRQSTHVPFGYSSFLVPRVGVCSVRPSTNLRQYFLICSSAFRYPPALVSFHFLQSATDPSGDSAGIPFGQPRRISYSPFPADVGISPIDQDFAQVTSSVPWQEVVVSTMDSLDHIHLNFEIKNLRLGDFEMFPKNMGAAFLNASPKNNSGNQIIFTQPK